MTLPCIICDKPLEGVFKGDYAVPNQPYAGTTFISHGHYGSTIYDPMVIGEHIEINLCDDCLRAKADKVLMVVDKTKRNFDYTPWEPHAVAEGE